MSPKAPEISKKILVIDCGSTNTKAAVFDQSGCISDIYKSSNEGAVQKDGQLLIEVFQKSFQSVVSKVCKQYNDIVAIGITGLGPTMCLCKKTSGGLEIPEFACSYTMSTGIDRHSANKIEVSEIIGKRGIVFGPQYIPEQLFQRKEEGESLNGILATSLLAVIGSVLDASMLHRLSVPSASYMGLINVETGEYIKEIFDLLNISQDIFPKLTVGSSCESKIVGLSSKVNIYELGVDGPTLQHNLGGTSVTLGFRTTIAVRINTRKPLNNLPWNVLYKDKEGNMDYVSGKAANAGSGTWQLYFGDGVAYEKFESALKALITSTNFAKTLENLPIELPFERGERDGFCKSKGLYSTTSLKPSQRISKDIELFYVLTEGILFNMIQLINNLVSAVKINDDLNASTFIVTGVLARNSVIRSLLYLMIKHLLSVDNIKFYKPVLDEVGLTSSAMAVFRQEGLIESIPGLAVDQDVIIDIDSKIWDLITKRWRCFQDLYDQGTTELCT